METGGFDRKVKFLQKAVCRLLSHRNAQLSSGQVDMAKTLGRTSEPQAPDPGLTGSAEVGVGGYLYQEHQVCVSL